MVFAHLEIVECWGMFRGPGTASRDLCADSVYDVPQPRLVPAKLMHAMLTGMDVFTTVSPFGKTHTAMKGSVGQSSGKRNTSRDGPIGRKLRLVK